MNERIRQLEKQCWSHYVNGVLIDGHLHFDSQKFAELIVAECCQFENSYGGEAGLVARHYSRKIKEHFGVKE